MMQIKTKILGLMLCLSYVPFSAASTEQLQAQLDNDLEPLMKKVVEWPLVGDDVETFETFTAMLNDLDDVQSIYHNVE